MGLYLGTREFQFYFWSFKTSCPWIRKRVKRREKKKQKEWGSEIEKEEEREGMKEVRGEKEMGESEQECLC